MTTADAVRALRALVTTTQVELSEAEVRAFVDTYQTADPQRLWRAVEHWLVHRKSVPQAGQLWDDDPLDAWTRFEAVVGQYGPSRHHPRLPLLTNLALDLCGGYGRVARLVMRGDQDIRSRFVNTYSNLARHETVRTNQAQDSTESSV